ncbi:MAG TPA: hypothetical protein VFW40_13410 [Capsulimonadaceae bacterium]|nr:hypothetical protein [Capsulimonadaceae bacterium]
MVVGVVGGDGHRVGDEGRSEGGEPIHVFVGVGGLEGGGGRTTLTLALSRRERGVLGDGDCVDGFGAGDVRGRGYFFNAKLLLKILVVDAGVVGPLLVVLGQRDGLAGAVIVVGWASCSSAAA